MPRIRQLTNKDLSMLLAIAGGDKTEEIARKSGYAFKTVETMRLRMYKKLGAKNAAHAVALGYQNNIL